MDALKPSQLLWGMASLAVCVFLALPLWPRPVRVTLPATVCEGRIARFLVVSGGPGFLMRANEYMWLGE